METCIVWWRRFWVIAQFHKSSSNLHRRRGWLIHNLARFKLFWRREWAKLTRKLGQIWATADTDSFTWRSRSSGRLRQCSRIILKDFNSLQLWHEPSNGRITLKSLLNARGSTSCYTYAIVRRHNPRQCKFIQRLSYGNHKFWSLWYWENHWTDCVYTWDGSHISQLQELWVLK